jgi:hypothetical protein
MSHVYPKPGPPNLLGGARNFGKIWSAYKQHEVQSTEWKMKKCMYNYSETRLRKTQLIKFPA